MDEIVKHINDTNASYRTPNAGDAKNTDLFLDNEHYELFKGAGEKVTVRFSKENLSKAILFIASILPRKYDNSSAHKKVSYSSDFVIDQLLFLDYYFKVDGKPVTAKTQTWNARKDVPKKNGEIDNRFYFNGLLEEVSYVNANGNNTTSKFTIRNYLAGGYSDLHIAKGDDGIFDVWITNALQPYYDHKEDNLDSLNNDSSSGSQNPAINSYLTAIRTKPFLLLAGISGTGKSRIVRKLAQATDNIDTFANDDDRWKLHSPQNFQLIQVKPNWHNSMDLVGFKSNIGGEHYEMTPFIEFVAKAWQHQDTPFFLCLDEMNLAPVEEYFAEFLSAIESRSNEGGSYETDPIIKPFRDFGEKVAKEMIDKLLGEELESLKAEDIVKLSLTAQRFLTMGLTLPKNLIVMGTVNMDETTFSFSRKVLDRAMSIEMNEVMYDDFLSGKTENDIEVLVERNSDLVNRPISGLKVKDEDSQSVINFLSSINALLDNTPYKLGYRAANEALLYVSAAKTFGCDDWKKAMDDFTLMKILSRIEGDDSKLKTQDGKDLLSEFKYLLSSTYGFSVDSKTLKKLNQMINILDRDKFVSFWG